MNAGARRRGVLATFLLGAMLTAWVPLFVQARQGIAGIFKLFAADAFYYLAIARASRGFPGFSYDGRYPTNGFHPLWEWLQAALVAVLDPGPAEHVRWVHALGVAGTALGAGLLAAAVARHTGRLALALLAASPGLYFLLLPEFNPHYGALWSFANGMESPLSLLVFGLLLQRLPRAAPQHWGHPAIAVALCAAVLARLDDALLVVAVAAVAAWHARGWRARLRALVRTAWLPALAVLALLAWNRSFAGMALPVSGVAKAGGDVPGLLRNGYALMTTLLPFFDPLGRGALYWSEQAWRIAQMVAPAAVATLWLWRERHLAAHAALTPPLRAATSAFALYVVLKAAYGFAFVGLWHQGHWYYPVSIAVFGWILSLWAHEALLRLRVAPQRIAVALALGYAWLQANQHAHLLIESPRHAGYYALWQRGPEIDAALERVCPGCGVLELDDGILAATLARPVMSGSGLALDAEGHAARERGALLALAHARGFPLLATQYYALDEDAYASPEALARALPGATFLRDQDLSGWHFEVAYTDLPSGVHFVRFRPRDEAPPAGALSPPPRPAPATARR